MSETTTITLHRSLVNRLLHEAQTRPDHEVCGLIGGKDGHPCSLYPATNIAGDPQRHFLLDPKDQIAAMKRMRERGESLFAIYHSHPTAPAVPSREDIEQIGYDDALLVIISLETKGVLELRAFRLEPSQIQEIPLEMEEV